MIDPVKRAELTQATMKQWQGVNFRLGHADCARLVASHVRRFGHKVRVPSKGSYGTPRSALKALRDRGYETMADAIDDIGLERIAPAAALPGDLIALPSDSPIGCITVAVGNSRVLGFHDDIAMAEVLQPIEYAGAWRV